MNDNKNWIHIVIIVVILAAIGGGYYYWSKNKDENKIGDDEYIKQKIQEELSKMQTTIDQINPPEAPENEDIQSKEFKEKEATVKMKDFYNKDHNVSMQYPADWEETDLGGAKNVATPLLRENIGFFYLPEAEVDENDPRTAIVSVKLLRFVIEESVEISSLDDWYNYMKSKIDEFIANPLLSENYELLEIKKGSDIDGKWTIVEDYIENKLITGKDFYIFNGDEFYQFVTKAPNAYFANYLPLIQKTVNSFRVGD